MMVHVHPFNPNPKPNHAEQLQDGPGYSNQESIAGSDSDCPKFGPVFREVFVGLLSEARGNGTSLYMEVLMGELGE